MTRILVLSFDSEASPSIHLTAQPKDNGGRSVAYRPYGWGLAWYPQGDAAAASVKDPTSFGDTPMTKVLSEWRRFRSSTFVCHMLGAAKRRTQQDTHPFLRTHAGRTWVMAHNGDLKGNLHDLLPLGEDPAFEPVGRTDSEHAFCWLLEEIRKDRKVRRLRDAGWPQLHAWFRRLNELGTTNIVLTDGLDICVYHDKDRFNGLYWLRRRPPHEVRRLSWPEFTIDFDDVHDLNRTVLLFSSRPLEGEPWRAMEPGQLLVASHGSIVWDSAQPELGRPSATSGRLRAAPPTAPAGAASPPAPAAPAPSHPPPPAGAQRVREGGSGAPCEALDGQARTRACEPGGGSATAVLEGPAPAQHDEADRVLRVVHETAYRYDHPVERSSHVFRLHPVQDVDQIVEQHALVITPDGLRAEVEDVFGNRATRLEIEADYKEMRLLATSTVRLRPQPPLTHNAPHRRLEIPLVWMPWQRQMMTPYLLPPELPETQLRELSAYAMGFVERQDYDLVETLLDMNQSIYRDYAYVPNSTNLETTPFEVYTSRRGVCQDFANLLICLARLLNVPARYRVGYIYTGGDYENKIQSDASHAWAELYLPWMGWRGFDPTNGCLANRDHIRVACGRNFRDATPTSGTIYRGGGTETLTLSVRVEEVNP